MSDQKELDIIKKAIIMEHRGKALYLQAARETKLEAVKDLFNLLADEEENHIQILTEQLKAVASSGKYQSANLAQMKDENDPVLTRKIIEGINAAGYEAAVVSAALEFEKNAVKFYGDQAEAASSDEEKKIFSWLSQWEKGHMTMLAQIDRQVMENIWNDNNFWPLD